MSEVLSGINAANREEILNRAIKKAAMRILPMLLAMYVLSFLDRANIAFAKQAFQSATGVTDIAFAFGASIFFIGYAIFEFPSNLMLHKFGARRWMSRIMISWGIVASCMLFVMTDASFVAVRLLLGAMEAGFFPGAILYMTYWFPAKARGRIFGVFYIGAPLAMIFGGPIAGAFLEMDGLMGLQGWQWLFLIEGVATVLFGFFVWWYLTDHPADAHWLTEEERTVLAEEIATEDQAKEASGHVKLGQALKDPLLLKFCAIYFLIQVAGYGLTYYMPSQIAGLLQMKIGLTVGFVTAIPWTFATIAAFFYPPLAVKLNRRMGFGVAALVIVAIGLSASGNLPPAWAVLALCFAEAGVICGQPVFWTFPSGYYTGYAAAGSLAVINAVGNLGGFCAPNLKVWAELGFGPNAGLYALAAAPFIGAIILYSIKSKVPADGAVEAPAAIG